MITLELVKTRRSVRTFDGRALSEADVNALKEFIKTIENPYGIPVEFIILDAKANGLSSPVIQGESHYVCAKVKKVENCDVAFGISFEQLVMYAWSLGIGTTWLGGTFKRDFFEKTINLQSDELMCCVSPLGYPAKKLSFKESIMRKAIKADWRMPSNEIFFDGSFNNPLKCDDKVIADALEIVRLAPSAVNIQPWRIVRDGNAFHFYIKHSKGYAQDGWDMQMIDIGIAINHFMDATGGTLSTCCPSIPVNADTDYVATVNI